MMNRGARPLGNDSGMALILTILVISLLTIAVVDSLHDSWIETELAGQFRDGTNALYAARSGQSAAKLILIEDARNGIPVDAMTEEWAQSTIPLPIGDEYAFFSIKDESGKINLNMLTTDRGYPNERWIKIFNRLLERLELEPELAGALIDWLDPNSDVTSTGGAEDGYYLSLKRPYRPKNGKLDSLAELALVKGFTPKVMKKIKPFVTLWSSGLINVNTAPTGVLWALDDEMTKQTANEVIMARTEKPFNRREDIKRVPGMDSIYPRIALSIGIRSDIFSVESSATFNEVTKTIRAVYKRSPTTVQTFYYKTL